MIQKGTYINVVDNSGAKKAFCINIINSGYKQRYAKIGNLILVSIKKVKFSKNMRVKKGEIHTALIVNTSSQTNSLNFNYRKNYENSVILLNKKNKMLGTRIFGKIPKTLKYTKFLKLITLASGTFV
jgi:large subunit ribosomal protein L14